MLWLSIATSYFDVCFSITAEYENEDIPKIHLHAEEPTQGPSTNEYSKCETCILDHWGQISVPTTAAKGLVFVSTVISYSLAYDAAGVMNDDNFVTSLWAPI